MKIDIPRRLTPRSGIALQNKLAPLVSEKSGLPRNVKHLIGCDATYYDGTTIAAATCVDYQSLKPQRVKIVKERTRFPYIPGLLAFREAPAVLRAIRALKTRDYICLVDAHGLAHPRKFGLACFIGVALDRPTIGVAKSLLCGRIDGNMVVDEQDYQIARLLQLPESRKAVFVSVGHKISLDDAVAVVQHCLTKSGPIPISLAHEEVTRRKWQIKRLNQAS